MHAVVHRVTFNDRSAAESDLDRVVSGVTGMPGFVAGYWVGTSADAGVAAVMFDSEEAAQGFASFLRGAPAVPGVTLDRESIEVGQVMAHA